MHRKTFSCYNRNKNTINRILCFFLYFLCLHPSSTATETENSIEAKLPKQSHWALILLQKNSKIRDEITQKTMTQLPKELL